MEARSISERPDAPEPHEKQNSERGANTHRQYDHLIRQRLAAIIAASGYSQQDLADAIGVQRYRIHRLLSGTNLIIDASLTCAIAEACGQPPHVLYDPSIDLPYDLTGVTSIDHMLRDAYNDNSSTGLAGIKRHAAPDYCVLSDKYDERQGLSYEHLLVDVGPTPGRSQQVRRGLTLQDEIRLNQLAADHDNTHTQVVLADAALVDDMVWVQYTTKTYYGTTRLASDIWNFVDLLVLDHPIEKYRSNARYKPKIRRRLWRALKEMPDQHQSFDSSSCLQRATQLSLTDASDADEPQRTDPTA